MSDNKAITFSTIHDYDVSLYNDLKPKYQYQPDLTKKLDKQDAEIVFDQEIINEIVLWKVNRYVSTEKSNWLQQLNSFKDDKEVDEDKLRNFLSNVLKDDVRGIRLAMASTFLRFRNPKVYQIIDEHTYRVVMRTNRNIKEKLSLYHKPEEQIEVYIEYLKKLKNWCVKKNLDFEEADRNLYQFDIEKNGDFNGNTEYKELSTAHCYIADHPIDPNSEKLILGTIHPHFTDDFDVQFFYGNRASLWKIFAAAFPNELLDPLDKEQILSFLNNRGIAISDTILACKRKKISASDSDLTNLQLNHNLIEQIRNSAITEIYFTSSFQKNNAFRLFYEDILGKKLNPQIKKVKQVILDESVFGRPVKLTCLLSPSGAANIGLSKSPEYMALKDKYTSDTPVSEYKIDWYKRMFQISNRTHI